MEDDYLLVADLPALPSIYWGQIKMRDGSLSDPQWLIGQERAFHPFHAGTTGPGIPRSGVVLHGFVCRKYAAFTAPDSGEIDTSDPASELSPCGVRS